MKKLAVCVVAMALSVPAFAAHKTHHTASSVTHSEFVKLDVNKDGVIDETEAKADSALSAAFASIASDGKLDEKAYAAWKKSQATKH